MKKNFGRLTINSKLLYFLSISLMGVLILQPLLHAQTVAQQLWVTNGGVNAMARSGNTIYIGGGFSHVGPNIAFGVPVSKHSGTPDLRFVMPNGDVYVALPDGSGGWYIGGTFSAVGGQERKLLARINADGSLHPWNPNVLGLYVSSMIIANDRLYVAGSYSVIAGEDRNLLASFDLATGQLTSWKPQIGGLYINAIALNGNTMYVAGGFWTLGGAARTNLGALNINTGLATGWDPVGDDFSLYRTLAVHDNSVFIGGQFTTLGGQSRLNLGSVDTVTGQANNWNFPVNGDVYSLVVDHHTLYVGGSFSSINYQTRYNLASFSLLNLRLSNWKPQVNNVVNMIALKDGKIYIGGYFTLVNGVRRDHIAAFHSGSGQLSPFRVPVNGTVTAISVDKKSMYLGGGYTSIGGEPRRNIAAIDATTGSLLPWDPGSNDIVNNLIVADQKLFVAGDFDSIGGQGRGKLASFDLATGHLTSWNPGVTGGYYGDNAPGYVKTMAIYENTLYFIGSFTRVGGVSRKTFAAVDATSGTLKPFYPLTGETDLQDLALSNGRLYVCGVFTEMAGQPRSGLASFNLATGQLTPWNPSVPLEISYRMVKAMATWNNTVYLAGGFEEINGQPRRGLAAVDGTTGLLKDWNPNAPIEPWTGIYELVTDGVNVYLGTYSMDALIILDAATGEASGFHPLITNANGTADDGEVMVILPSGNRLYVGGAFTSIDDQPRPFFAGFDMQASMPKLIFFNTQVKKHGSYTWVDCNWSTTRDQALSHFLVERSADNMNFSSIGRIDASKQPGSVNSYEIRDAHPLPGVSWYRLRMVNKDNSERLSSSNKIDLGNENMVAVYPLPADKELTVVFRQIPRNAVDIVLLNQNGHPVWARKNMLLTKGAGIVSIPTVKLVNGYYLLRITSGNTVMTKAVIVQH